MDIKRENELKPKDLIGIPWRVAFALQADGWWLRSDIIWHKPNPMPESVTDRPTKAHEYLFLLSKSAKYYYDADAIKEPGTTTEAEANNKWRSRRNGTAKGQQEGIYHGCKDSIPFGNFTGTRNKRTVWTIATQPMREAHFAIFPENLIEPCILAGCPKEVCAICGAPVLGVVPSCGCAGVEHRPGDFDIIMSPTGTNTLSDPSIHIGRAGMSIPRTADGGTRGITRYQQRKYAEQLAKSQHRKAMELEAGEAFSHYIRTDLSGARPILHRLFCEWVNRGWLIKVLPPFPPVIQTTGGVVLDPFFGSGTTGIVAYKHNRKFIGIDLSETYLSDIAIPRINKETQQMKLF